MASTNEFKLFRLTWPIFLELFLFMMLGMADTFMLSAISDNAVSGVGAANQFLSIAILILEVIGNGASIVVAQYLGSRNREEAGRISALAVSMNLLVGLLISVVFFFFHSSMLQAMNVSGEILQYGESYFAIVGSAIFLQAVLNSFSAVIRVHGYTKEAMFVSFGMNVFHVIMNYFLIFGNGFFPELGVEGAAISTMLSRFLALLVFIWLFYRVMEWKPRFVDYWQFSRERISKIVKIGLPSAFEQIIYQACQMTFLFYVTFLGAEAMAARQYAANLSQFIYLFAMAVAMGTSIMVGRYVGAGRKDDAYVRVWGSVKIALIGTVIMVGAAILFRESFMRLFTKDSVVIEMGAQVILLSILLETGRAINMVIINSMRAAGDASFPVWMGLLSMVGMSLPLGYLLVFQLNLGLAGVWLAIAADEWTRAVIMYFRWRSRKWENYALVTPESAQATH
ncbi:MATE family efflux transporter [Gorillibacterium timonense]|uniref:MATE family efflux transporter n=1 Tax=Gorillibacterium timonense TaxID=1689269 RepID=UPI001F355D88|nr:MATE family efflux transporter [Gorillibacterium timonense]